jgi:hypothetical protein
MRSQSDTIRPKHKQTSFQLIVRRWKDKNFEEESAARVIFPLFRACKSAPPLPIVHASAGAAGSA